MGKAGGCELNYISDVDVIFVAEPADGVPEEESTAVATDLATRLMRICSASTAAGSLWQVDPALRPEGKNGPLVRTVASHRAYYERWAKTWEFQALLKARPVAGDPEVGRAYCDAVQPMVWQASAARTSSTTCRRCAAGSSSTSPPRRPTASSSSGPGGLRDVEFSVQLLQLVHGRADETLRTGHHARRARGALGRRLRRARGRGDARHGIPAAAHPRAPHPAASGCAARTSCRRPRADLRRLGRALGHRSSPGRGRRGAVAGPAARGAPAARADLLPPPAVRRGPAVRLRRAPHARGGAGAAVGAGLPRPPRRAAPPRGAHRRASAGVPPSSASCCR